MRRKKLPPGKLYLPDRSLYFNLFCSDGKTIAISVNDHHTACMEEVPEWNFTSINDDTSFYINADGNLVISFNEGDVGPMSMGVVEFTIPHDVIADILK